ncbi:MAG TPA: CehA/McbA family metallohydrolase [Candidatus Deferrimicrobium sp.]|nr:CehA/McbA family metallohydrolase [Candidatus Deferrimicrobium sp.]
MDEVVVALLDASGQWTHRQRHRHHRFAIDVPDGTAELRLRFSWEPLDLGSEHLGNAVNLSLFGPAGFRGSAARSSLGQDITIGVTDASPGFLVGPIPAGPWSLVIGVSEILNDGVETGLLTWRLEASARIGDPDGAPGDGSGSVIPAPATPRSPGGTARWYRGDLHSHTTHSDGDITVPDRVRGAVERGQDFLAITDHNTVSHFRELDAWPATITPIRGSEVTTFHGHMNCFGLERVIDWRDAARGSGAARIVEQAHDQGALISINHPSAFGDPWCSGCHWDFALVDFATIDAIEVWNGRWRIPESDNNGALAFWTDLLDAGFRPTALSGTDSHSAEEDEYVALPLNHVHAEDRSEGAILDGIRNGRVFLSSGPTLSFRARGSDGVDVVLPGGDLPADGLMDLTVDVEDVAAPATLWYVTSGSMVAIGECGPGSTHLIHERLVASKWWRLELRTGSADTGDILLLTNPVYVPVG